MESNIFLVSEKKNVAEIPISNLIENLRGLKKGFHEDRHSSEYLCYILLKQKGQNRYIYKEFKKWDGQTHNFEIPLKSQDINGGVEELKLFIRQLTDENKSFLDDLIKENEIQIDDLSNLGFTRLDGKFCLDKQSGSYKLDELIYIDSKGTKFGVAKSAVNDIERKKKYITVDGRKCEVSFEKGPLLKEKETLYFDALYIFEQAKNKVMKRFSTPKIRMAFFIKSRFFDDDKWHYDDFATRELNNINDSSGGYISQHDTAVCGKIQKVDIVTDGLKVFVGSLVFEDFIVSQLSDNKKMQTFRNNGFVEVDLHEISYVDPRTNKLITKKVFLTPDFLQSNTIDKSIVAIEENRSNVVGKIYRTPEEKKEVWNRLKSNLTSISKKARIVNCASFKINRPSLATFLGNILEQNDNLRFELVINGGSCEKQSDAFSFDYKSGTEEIAVEHDDSIYSLCLKIFSGKNKDPIKPFLFLQKDGEYLCIFAGNKKTDIKVTENKSLTLKCWGENFLKNRYKSGLKSVSNNSFCISKLSNKIELPTPDGEKPMRININENQK